MTRRTEFEPTSMTAACRDSALLSARGHMIDRARHVFHLLAPAGKAGVGHEILVRRERARVVPGRITAIAAVAVQGPALRFVLEVREHDLLENLLVDGRVLDGRQ